jgi:hypothetical protein
MNEKLEFKPAIMNGQNVFLAEPYKVVHYDWTKTNGTIIEKPHWSTYYRIYDKASKKMLFGDSVEMLGYYEGKSYDTKEQAFEACQKHFENRSDLK